MLDRRNILVGIAGGVWGAGRSAFAQKAAADIPPAATTDPTPLRFDVRGSIQEQIDVYIDKSGLRNPEAVNVSVLQGVGTVLVRADHPQWVQHRTMAFEDAILKAQSAYISSQQIGVASQALSSVYKAANLEPPPYDEGALGDPGKVAELARKALAVTGGAMNKALEDLGIDPKSLEKAPPAQKHVQFQRAVAISGMERSFGSLTGMVTRFTVEARDDQGNYQIGVVALVSPKLQSLAQLVLKLRGEFLPDPSKASDFKKVIADPRALVDMFGVRWMYDLTGLPVLVSFGQWGIERVGSKNAAVMAEFEDTAMRQAEVRAGQQIAEFLSASGDADTKVEFKSQLEQIAERHPDGYIGQKEATTTLEAPLREAMRRRARVSSLSGVTTLRRWKQSHPDAPQQVIYGAVRYWSAAGELAVRAQKDGRTEQAPAGAAAPHGQAGTRVSKEIGDF